jgi:hypothetical protein
VMTNVDDVWWCRTPKNTVVYGSGERRIALHLANHAPGAKKGEGAVGCLSLLGLLVSPLQRNIMIVASLQSLHLMWASFCDKPAQMMKDDELVSVLSGKYKPDTQSMKYFPNNSQRF